ncbi:MAG: hypothetical protein H7840_09290 [Alphaproteobacteria bacterium]
MERPPRGSTPAEQQAILVLEAANKVMASIEEERRLLKNADMPEPERHRIRQSLIERTERLVNLLFLASSHLSTCAKTEFFQVVQQGLSALRARLFSTGAGLVADRAKRIRIVAQSVVNGEAPCSLGLTERLSQRLHEIITMIEVLGGLEALPRDAHAEIEETQRAVARLAEFEGRVGGRLMDLSEGETRLGALQTTSSLSPSRGRGLLVSAFTPRHPDRGTAVRRAAARR